MSQIKFEMLLDIYGDITMMHRLEFREEMELRKGEIILCKMKFITVGPDNVTIWEYVDSTA